MNITIERNGIFYRYIEQKKTLYMKRILIALGLLAVIATQSCSTEKGGYGCKSSLSGGGTYHHHGYYAKP